MRKKANLFCLFFVFLGSFFLHMHFGLALEFDFSHSGYYYEMNKQGDDNYASWKLDYYSINNQVAYCIETGVDEGESMIEGSWSDTNLPNNIKNRVLLLAYYGYGYPGHENERYRAATQALLWETILGNGAKVTYSRERYGNGEIYNVNMEKEKIENLVEHHYDKPSFADTTTTVQIGKKISLVDTNNVLSSFEVSFPDDVSVQIHENVLDITPMQDGDIVLNFTKKKNYTSNYKIFYGDEVQNMLVPGNVDTITFQVKIKAVPGIISLTKYDSETKVPQGDATLEGAEYVVYRKSDDVLVSYMSTDINGEARAEGFFYGEYYLKEQSNSIGYELDETVYYINFYDATHVHIRVPEKVVKGRIRVLKLDSETNMCRGQGDATLEGAEYGIYDAKGNLVETLTIASDCTAISKELPYGMYEVRELSPSTGYQLDTTVYKVNVHTSDIVEVISKEEVIKGSGRIKITKVDNETGMCYGLGSAILEGAEYGIYDEKGSLVETLTIASDCTAISKELPYGTYEVREISPSEGYKLDKNIYPAEINSNETITIVSREEVIKGQIKIVKKDKDINRRNSTDDVTLVGAKYGIYDANDLLVGTLIINDKCEAISQKLAYGHYTVKEIEASFGYELDTTIYPIFIENEEMISILSLEPILKNRILLLKQMEQTEGSSTILLAEEGIVFEIYDRSDYLYDSIMTDKTGWASIELPFGVWRFHQKNTYQGYTKVDDFLVTVDYASEKDQIYTLVNKKIYSSLQIYKVDSETKEPIALAGTTFKIVNVDTNQYISQQFDGKIYDTFETDATGKVSIPLKLEAGNYKLMEVKSPNGYLLNEDGFLFTINQTDNYDKLKENEIITIYFENTPIKGQVAVYKSGELFTIENGTYSFSDIPLQGITFGIYAQDIIFTSDKSSVYYDKDVLVDTLVTSQDGKAISKLLPIGSYYLKEIETREGYVLDNRIYRFEITEKDNKTPIVYVSYTLKNDLNKGTLEIVKVDSENGTTLSDTKIQIFTEQEELIFSGKTGPDGKLIVSDLPIGVYYAKELEPTFGYLLDKEKKYFKIKENGDLVHLVMENDRMKGILEIQKKDEEGCPLEGVTFGIYDSNMELITEVTTNQEGKIILELPYGKYFYQELESLPGFVNDTNVYSLSMQGTENIVREVVNKRGLSTVTIHKIDNEGRFLEGVRIGIYTMDGILLYSGVTDAFGIFQTRLENGHYYYQEISALDNYLLDDEKHYFKIDGEEQTFTLINQREEICVPNTFKSRSYLLEIFTFLLFFGVVRRSYVKE